VVSYSQIINIDTEPHLHKRCFTLTGLYANTEYDAYVYLRSSKAVGTNMYSEPAAITFSTLPTCKWIHKIERKSIVFNLFLFYLYLQYDKYKIILICNKGPRTNLMENGFQLDFAEIMLLPIPSW